MTDMRDVLLQAMMDAEGLPECSAEEYAQRVIEQLDRLGYDLVKRPGTGTVYGIRSHLPRTKLQDEMERRLAEQLLNTAPVVPPELLP